ncbi:hypothetical protein HAX54_051842 [Datura stramonium]|uniref:Uncharacterized protein n=1 Tax=Datura stramonium TaxID=4076 RepID=A0ABS8SYQ4_DATST|nr:hypothetical protein [Datura stramonium]
MTSSSTTTSAINVPLSDTIPPSIQGEPMYVPSTSSFTPPSFETLSSTPVPSSTETPITTDPSVNPDIGLGTDGIPIPDSLKALCWKVYGGMFMVDYKGVIEEGGRP